MPSSSPSPAPSKPSPEPCRTRGPGRLVGRRPLGELLRLAPACDGPAVALRPRPRWVRRGARRFPWSLGDGCASSAARATLVVVEDQLLARRGVHHRHAEFDHAVQLARPRPFRDAYARHSHVTADGVPVAWLARRLDRRIAKVSGSDLMLPMAAIAARQRCAGRPESAAPPAVLDAAAAALQARFPGLPGRRADRAVLSVRPDRPRGRRADRPGAGTGGAAVPAGARRAAAGDPRGPDRRGGCRPWG